MNSLLFLKLRDKTNMISVDFVNQQYLHNGAAIAEANLTVMHIFQFPDIHAIYS